MKNRNSGFTLIEALVAVVLFVIGVLTFVQTSALVTRLIARGTRAEKASVLAQQRIDILRATTCPLLAGGSDAVGAVSRAWTVTTVGNAQRILVTVSYPQPPSPNRVDTVTTTIDCTP